MGNDMAATFKKHFFVFVIVVLTLGLFALLPLVAKPRSGPRELVLVARGMTFYLDGNPAPNPTIRVKQGEEIHLVFRNEEVGVTHDFAVPGLKVSVRPLRGDGLTKLNFRVPKKPGSYQYLCNPHSQMMTGQIEVE